MLGPGGKDDKGNYLQAGMQLLHNAYNLQKWHKTDKLKQIYNFVRCTEGLEVKFMPLPEPIVTRCWLVEACAVKF